MTTTTSARRRRRRRPTAAAAAAARARRAAAAAAAAEEARAAGGGGDDDDDAPQEAFAEPLASRCAYGVPCCSLTIDEGATVAKLKRALRTALAAARSQPPGRAHAVVKPSLPSRRLRLFRRAGGRAGAVLRDGTTLRECMHSAFEDKEVVVQLLHAQERLARDALLLSCVLLDAVVGAPTAPSGVLARAHSPASALLEALAAVTGVPLDQLAIALPPPAERPPLSAQLLATLSWDDPEVLGASSLVRRPLLLADGAVVVVRDRNHPPPQMPDGGGEGGGAGGRRRRIVFGAEPPEVIRPPREAGVRIAGFD